MLKYNNSLNLFCQYEENVLSDYVDGYFTILGLKTLDYSDNSYNPDSFLNLLMSFIQMALPDLKYTYTCVGSKNAIQMSPIEPFNGWWSKALNVQLGYGLY